MPSTETSDRRPSMVTAVEATLDSVPRTSGALSDAARNESRAADCSDWRSILCQRRLRKHVVREIRLEFWPSRIHLLAAILVAHLIVNFLAMSAASAGLLYPSDNCQGSVGTSASSLDCSLGELLHHEYLMRSSAGPIIRHCNYVNLTCENRRSRMQRVRCVDGSFSTFPNLTCNYQCKPLTVYALDANGIVSFYRMLDDGNPVYQARNRREVYSCRENMATPFHDNTTKCVPIENKLYTGEWSNWPVCYHKSLRTCQPIPPKRLRINITDYYSNFEEQLMQLGDRMTVRCWNRQDRSLRVRCSYNGWEELTTADQPHNLATLCEQPCPAARVDYDKGGPRNEYLVHNGIGLDHLQSFPENSTVKLSCAAGYTALTESSTCRYVKTSNGLSGEFKWDPPPKCVKTRQIEEQTEEPCNIGELTADGLVNASWTDEGKAMCHTSCPIGYQLNKGHSYYRCQEGRWLPAEPAMELAEHLEVARYKAERGTVSCASSVEVQRELTARHLRVVSDAVEGPWVRVNCSEGYKLATGRQSAVLQCTGDRTGLQFEHHVVCRTTHRLCVNPFMPDVHKDILSLGTDHTVPSGQSVAFTCRNGRGPKITATCTDNDWDPDPRSLICRNPCPRPTILFEVDGRVAYNESCWHATCLDGHQHNSSISYKCPVNWERTTVGSICSWSQSEGRHVWSPQPACQLKNMKKYCKYDDIRPHLPTDAHCNIPQRPPTDLLPLNQRITCECEPGTVASQRGYLYCRRTLSGHVNWTTGNYEKLECRKQEDLCPGVSAGKCKKAYPEVIHMHTTTRVVTINGAGRINMITSSRAGSRVRCRQLRSVYRFLVPYHKRSVFRARKIEGKSVRIGLGVCNTNHTRHVYPVTWTSKLKLFGNQTAHAPAQQHDACVALFIAAPPAAKVKVRVQLKPY